MSKNVKFRASKLMRKMATPDFNPNSPPSFNRIKPSLTLKAGTVIEEVFNGRSGYFRVGDREFYVDTELDYDYGEEVPKCKILEVTPNNIKNPSYDSELRSYNYAKTKFKKDLAEWNENKKKWDKGQEKLKVAAELKQLKSLKEKYGSGN